ncbi:MAG: class F sortase [Nocardioidaceae bacterium]
MAAALLLLAGCSAGRADPTNAPPATVPSPSAGRPPAGDARVGREAPSQVHPQRPTTLRLPSGQVMPVDVSSTGSDGGFRLPIDIGHAGWWDGSARLGDPYGSVVLAAHVDSFTQGVGPFAELLSMHRGNVIGVGAGSLGQTFVVRSVRLVPRVALTSSSFAYSQRGGSRLVLITCGGPYDASQGGYRDNVVVVATPRGPVRGH